MARWMMLLLVLVTCPSDTHGKSELAVLPATAIKELGKVAKELAAKGRAADADLLLGILKDANTPDRIRKKIEAAVGKAGNTSTSRAAYAPKLAERLRKLNKSLARTLNATKDEGKQRTIASIMIRLSANQDEAHKLLGHIKREGMWFTKKGDAQRTRSHEIEHALMRARALSVDIKTSVSQNKTIVQVYGEKGVRLEAGPVVIEAHKTNEARLRRLVTTGVRMMALSHWFDTGEIKVPKERGRPEIVILDERDDFDRWRKLAEQAGTIDKKTSNVIKGWDFHWIDNTVVSRPQVEVSQNAMVMWCCWRDSEWALYGRRIQPCLGRGHVNWLCLRYLGVPMPRLNRIDQGKKHKPTTASPAHEREREYFKVLSSAGLFGTRAWLRYATQRGEAPAWSRAMLNDYVDIGGVNLLKTTVVTEYLQENREFLKVVMATRPTKKQASAEIPPAMAKALGTSLAEFEQRFHKWLLGVNEGLAERLDQPDLGNPKDTAAWLAYLNGIRRKSFDARQKAPEDLTLDRALCEGAKNHAAYLLLHPDEASKWPDIHAEVPGQKGFTQEGARAAKNSVIATGARDTKQALDWWMGTFYHRLPLLDPGLLHVGYGFKKGIAVLDTSSLRIDVQAPHVVVWPPRNGRALPTHFASGEMPHPVPGEDQTAWGYPITLQIYWQRVDPPIEMSLRVGSVTGDVVPCHYSTPDKPTNPELAPRGAYCLIPKQRLKSRTTYHVTATHVPGHGTIRWSFTTGR